MNTEQHLFDTGTGLRLRGLTSTASCADAGILYAEIAETVGRYGMGAVPVTCVVARGLEDALEALLPSLPGRRRRAGSVAMNAVWVWAATRGGRRPMLRAAMDARSARSWVQCDSPRIPHDKVIGGRDKPTSSRYRAR